jgi:hypothetical protein
MLATQCPDGIVKRDGQQERIVLGGVVSCHRQRIGVRLLKGQFTTHHGWVTLGRDGSQSFPL